MLACEPAVETDLHDSAWPEQIAQYTPAGHWVCKVMQHIGGLYEVKASAQVTEALNIGLGECDIRHAKFVRSALSVGETGEAEVDCQHLRAVDLPGYLDWLLTGSATGDQHSERFVRPERHESRRWELSLQKNVDGF